MATSSGECSRREFLQTSAAAAAPLLAVAAAHGRRAAGAEPKPTPPRRKIKLGVVGCGTRARYVMQLFRARRL